MAATEEVGTLWIRSHSLHPGREGAAQQMGEHTFTQYYPGGQTFIHHHAYEQTFTRNHPYVYEQTFTHNHPSEQTFTIAIVAGAEGRAPARD